VEVFGKNTLLLLGGQAAKALSEALGIRCFLFEKGGGGGFAYGNQDLAIALLDHHHIRFQQLKDVPVDHGHEVLDRIAQGQFIGQAMNRPQFVAE